MSDGSMGYAYSQITEYAEMLCDKELEELARDLAKVYHDAEWWHSSDSNEENYRKGVLEFKAKWFTGVREDRLRGYIDEIANKAKHDCLKLLEGELK